MKLRLPKATRSASLFPYTTLFRSEFVLAHRRQVQGGLAVGIAARGVGAQVQQQPVGAAVLVQHRPLQQRHALVVDRVGAGAGRDQFACQPVVAVRSEEHTSELQSLMRISYAVFCLKKKTKSK